MQKDSAELANAKAHRLDTPPKNAGGENTEILKVLKVLDIPYFALFRVCRDIQELTETPLFSMGPGHGWRKWSAVSGLLLLLIGVCGESRFVRPQGGRTTCRAQ